MSNGFESSLKWERGTLLSGRLSGMAEEKSLKEILSDATELRRTADELMKASEKLMEKWELLRRATGENQKEFAARARERADAAMESSDRHKRRLAQNRSFAADASEAATQGEKRQNIRNGKAKT
jgi:hypothetical protein